jgi:hypothetical protein
MAIYMPKVKTSLDEFRIFTEKIELKLRTIGQQEPSAPVQAVDATELQAIKFMCNNLKTEVDYQKKMFSVAKL